MIRAVSGENDSRPRSLYLDMNIWPGAACSATDLGWKLPTVYYAQSSVTCSSFLCRAPTTWNFGTGEIRVRVKCWVP